MLKIPNFVSFPLQGMVVMTSNKNIKADINQNGEIFMILNTKPAPQREEGYLYIYADHYNCQMLACCKVEVYSL